MILPKKVITPQKMTPGGEAGVWSNTRGVVYYTLFGSHQTYVYGGLKQSLCPELAFLQPVPLQGYSVVVNQLMSYETPIAVTLFI